ncbi:MAG: hypothetical protein ACLQVW_00885 [Limisphaerales bacterium]
MSDNAPAPESFYSKEVDKALMGLIKGGTKHIVTHVASEVGSTIKRMLAGGTEPFFRADLGERYLAHNIVSAGWALWAVTTVITCFTGSLIGLLLPYQFRALTTFCGVLLSAAVLGLFVKYCADNVKQLAQFRAQRKPYHSKSRGKARWNPLDEFKIRIGASVVLILFAPVTGIAFVISMFVTAGLVADQQAAIHSAYLDALDAQIEGQFMQDALLGKVPAEMTYLYQPLSEKMDSGLREDIAAAYVGKAVKMVAEPPKPKEPPAANATA